MRSITAIVYFVTLSLSLNLQFSTALAEPQKESVSPNPALPLEVGMSDLVPEAQRAQIQKILNIAILTVRAFPPANEDNPFDWKGDRTPLQNKKFGLIVTTSQDPITKKLATLPGGVPKNTDAVTTMFQVKEGDPRYIAVFIFADRIFFDEQGKPRQDGFARLVGAIAHELYGNATGYLKMKPEDFQKKMTFESRKQMEVSAFEAGLKFLERFSRDERFQKLSPKMKEDFNAFYRREKEGLEAWKSAKEQE